MLWGYCSQALSIGAGLLLLPLILYYLPPADVGLWFVFITLAGLAQLLEFGFQPTLARNAAYVYTGAQSLSKVGLPLDHEKNGAIDVTLLHSLIASSRKIYRIVASLVAVLMLGGGTAYIWTLLTPAQDIRASLLAWIMFSAGYVLTFYFGYFNALLQGRGDVTQASKVVVASRASLIIFGCVSTVMGFGLLGLGVSSMLSAIVGRMAAMWFFASDPMSKAASQVGPETGLPGLLGTLWHNASRMGAVQVGAFLIQRGNVLFASSFLGLEAAATYGMTVTVLMAVSGIAAVACQVQVPHLSALQIRHDRPQLASIYGEILVISGSIFLMGLITLSLFGNQLLGIIGSKVELLAAPLMLFYGFILLLEMNHSIAATYLTTTNQVPFVPAALLSGIAVFCLSFLLIKPFGLLGLIIAQGLSQLAYNNWKWPLEVRRHLEISYPALLGLGLRRLFKQTLAPRPG